MIELGNGGRYIDLDGLKNDLLGKTIELSKFCEKHGYDESEIEELKDLIAGEIEQCPVCKVWRESWDIDSDGTCSKCSEEPTFKFKQY